VLRLPLQSPPSTASLGTNLQAASAARAIRGQLDVAGFREENADDRHEQARAEVDMADRQATSPPAETDHVAHPKPQGAGARSVRPVSFACG